MPFLFNGRSSNDTQWSNQEDEAKGNIQMTSAQYSPCHENPSSIFSGSLQLVFNMSCHYHCQMALATLFFFASSPSLRALAFTARKVTRQHLLLDCEWMPTQCEGTGVRVLGADPVQESWPLGGSGHVRQTYPQLSESQQNTWLTLITLWRILFLRDTDHQGKDKEWF